MPRTKPSTNAPILLITASVAFLLASSTVGQITAPSVCVSALQPLFNTIDQSPCLVASFLGGVCSDGDFPLESLSPGEFYGAPADNRVNPCQCSSVFYSLISACGLCQNGTTVSWTNWITNCTANVTSLTTWPESIPADTAIPGWAFENVSTKNTFDVGIALADGSEESTAINVPTSSSSTFLSGSGSLPSVTAAAEDSPLSSSSASTSASASASATSSSSSGSSHTGAIAGGIAGGCLGAALLGVLVYLWRRRLLSRRSGAGARMSLEWPSTIAATSELKGGQAIPLMSEGGNRTNTHSQPGTLPRVYDPNDSSTFPSAAPPGTLSIPSSSRFNSTSQPSLTSSSTPFSGAQGSYRGAPEV